MKFRLSVLATISLFFIFTLSISAQRSWSLEECINYAFENNIQIKQSVLNVNSAEKDLSQSKYDLIPNLNASSTYNFGWGRNFDESANTYTSNNSQQSYFSLNSSVTLFNGFQMINNIRQKQFDYLAEKYNSDKIRNDM